MWSRDNPPPVDWNLFVHVGCPECGQDLHFKPMMWERANKFCYCQNPACALFNLQLEIELWNTACRIVKVGP